LVLISQAEQAISVRDSAPKIKLLAALAAPSRLPRAKDFCHWTALAESDEVECTLSDQLKSLLVSTPKVWKPEQYANKTSFNLKSKDEPSRCILECLQARELENKDCILRGPLTDRLAMAPRDLFTKDLICRQQLLDSVKIRSSLDMLVSLMSPEYLSSLKSQGELLQFIAHSRQAINAISTLLEKEIISKTINFQEVRAKIRETVLAPLVDGSFKDDLSQMPFFAQGLWPSAKAAEAAKEASEALRDQTKIFRSRGPSFSTRGNKTISGRERFKPPPPRRVVNSNRFRNYQSQTSRPFQPGSYSGFRKQSSTRAGLRGGRNFLPYRSRGYPSSRAREAAGAQSSSRQQESTRTFTEQAHRIQTRQPAGRGSTQASAKPALRRQ
jgi:hypothetical protein